MNGRIRHLLILIGFGCVASLCAQVPVNPAIPITNRVQVQPIRVLKSNGEMAPTFGNATTEAYIKNQINRIWAQAGVRIDWLSMVDYTNDFAYDGSPANHNSNPRPQAHLDTLVKNAPVPPKSSNATIVNLFFCSIVPGFPKTSVYAANGLAFLDSNGVTAWVGPSLLTFTEGTDLIAKVLAHEIGHNLGLSHTADGGDNLMSPGSSSGKLTTAQKNTIFTNTNNVIDGFDFLQPAPPPDNYRQWIIAQGVTGGPTGDDDLDTIPNLIEFMLGLNPKVPGPLPAPVRTPNGLTWTLAKQPLAVANGLVYQVKTSANLITWTNAGSPGSGSTIVQDNANTLEVRLDFGAVPRYMRLEVIVPAGLGAAAPPPFTPASAASAPRIYPAGAAHLFEIRR